MLLSRKTSVKLDAASANIIGHMCYASYKLWNVCNFERLHYKEAGLQEYPDWYYQKILHTGNYLGAHPLHTKKGQHMPSLPDTVLFCRQFLCQPVTVWPDVIQAAVTILPCGNKFLPSFFISNRKSSLVSLPVFKTPIHH